MRECLLTRTRHVIGWCDIVNIRRSFVIATDRNAVSKDKRNRSRRGIKMPTNAPKGKCTGPKIDRTVAWKDMSPSVTIRIYSNQEPLSVLVNRYKIIFIVIVAHRFGHISIFFRFIKYLFPPTSVLLRPRPPHQSCQLFRISRRINHAICRCHCSI